MKTSSLKPNSSRHTHGGFTLVELLIVVAIIAVLATLSVSVLGSAQNDARVAATQSRVRIIQRILEAELENYEVRRIPFLPAIFNLTQKLVGPTGGGSGGPGGSGVWADRQQPGVPIGAGNPAIFNVHFRNLKRMFVADLIRAEMPNGRQDIPMAIPPRDPTSTPPRPVVPFPSDNLTAYLGSLGIPPTDPDLSAIRAFELSGGISFWSAWTFDPSGSNDTTTLNARSREQRLADSAEMLYALLNQIEFNGTSALDSLGSNAVADTDGDGQLEIVDAWDEPIGFQFHQANLQRVPTTPPMPPLTIPPTTGSPANGVWGIPPIVPGTSTAFTELEVENRDSEGDLINAMMNGVKPVRVDQIRPFLSSAKLFEIEQTPVDFLTLQPRSTP